MKIKHSLCIAGAAACLGFLPFTASAESTSSIQQFQQAVQVPKAAPSGALAYWVRRCSWYRRCYGGGRRYVCWHNRWGRRHCSWRVGYYPNCHRYYRCYRYWRRW